MTDLSNSWIRFIWNNVVVTAKVSRQWKPLDELHHAEWLGGGTVVTTKQVLDIVDPCEVYPKVGQS